MPDSDYGLTLTTLQNAQSVISQMGELIVHAKDGAVMVGSERFVITADQMAQLLAKYTALKVELAAIVQALP